MAEAAVETERKGHGIISITFKIVALAMCAYQLLYAQVQIELQSPVAHLIIHLGFALCVVFLSLMLKSKRFWSVKVGLLLASVVVTVYFRVALLDLLMYRTIIKPIPPDLIMAGLVILITLVGSYLASGITFPVLTVISMIYLFFGRHLPSPFTVPAIRPERLLMWLGAAFGTNEGIYGEILRISGLYLFLFIVLGSFLQAFGALRFIMGLGQWFGSKLRSGPAAVAVVGSSLLGTVTGSTVANVTITGNFTIPMMKKAGYAPRQAGAIEAVASNGGQVMPPIMGIAAFLMAGFAGIPYIEIAIAGIGPAVLYYLCAFLYVQLTAGRMNIRPTLEPVKGRQLLLDAPIFLIPLGVLVFLLVKSYSLPFVAFWSIVSVTAVGLAMSLRKGSRLRFHQVITTITDGVYSASEVAVICAVIGIVSTVIKVSGLGIKLPLIIQGVSQGVLLIALLIAMASSILLGMGVPTQVAYIFVAIGAIPALLAMGVPLLQAHFFCFLSATFSHITPPVAFGALVAARIAGASYWDTCFEALKAAWTIFLLPFLVIYAPVIIFRPDVALGNSIVQVIAILIGIVTAQIALSDYFLTRLRFDERISFAVTAALCFGALFWKNHLLLLAGVCLFIISAIRQYRRRGQVKASS